MPALTPESALPLVAAGQAAFSALLLALHSGGNRTANRLLAALFLIFALNMGKVALYASGALSILPHLARVTFPLELLYGPLVWAFTRVSVGYPLTRRDSMHVVPAVLVLLALTPFYLESDEAKRVIMQVTQQRRTMTDWLLWLANWGTLSAYVAATVLTLRGHEERVRGELARTGPESLRWLHRLLWALVAAQIIEIGFVVTAGVLHRPFGSPFLNTLALLAISSTVAVLALQQPALRFRGSGDAEAVQRDAPIATRREAAGDGGTEGLLPPTVALLPHPAEPREQKYARSGLTPDDVTQIARRLDAHMRREEPWRDGDLSLTGLARQLQVPSHHLSRALNDVLQQSFFDYVNRHRVVEVQRLLADPSFAPRSILELAFTAGFNSKSSFNACFKEFTGSTPRAYRRIRQATGDIPPRPLSSG